MATDPALRPGPAPLTRGQQVLWAAQQQYAAVPLYNMALSFEIDGPLDEALFAQAFASVQNACDALRTVIGEQGGVPFQTVRVAPAFALPLIDLSTEPDPAAARQAWEQSRCERMLALDELGFDAALLKLGPQRYAWFLNQHHVFCDAWSFTVMYDELQRHYMALRRGEPAPPPAPAFADYRRHEQAAREAPRPAHWDRFAGASGPAPAPYGQRPATPSTRNERVTRVLDPLLSSRLRELAMRPDVRGLTLDHGLFRVFTTALFAFLHRVTDRQTVRLGAPAHNRSTLAFKRTAGLFMEVFPLQASIDGEDSFADLYARVREETDLFLRAVRPGASDPSINRSVHAVLNLIRSDMGAFDGWPVRVTWLHPRHADPQHQLRLQVHDFGSTGQYTLHFDCNVGVFDEALRAQLPAQFQRLLEAMLDDWDLPIAAAPLASGRDRESVARGADVARDDADHVVALIERQIQQRPEATALVCDDERWSFARVDEASQAVAAHIRPGTTVGLCLDRSAELVISMFGVLRAGAAFVSVDPAWPESRRALVLADAGCTLVLAVAAEPAAPPGATTLDPRGLDTPHATASGPAPIRSEGLAYLLYTSGSTGRPKGVMIEHGALANYVRWACDHYDRGRRLAFALFSSPTFDLTLTSIFVPLAAGGTIVVYPRTTRGADLAVVDVFEDDAVDVVKLTPSHLALLGDRDPVAGRTGQLIVGGEQLTTALARRLHQRFAGRIQIHNEYGPTEATIGCLVHTFDPERDHGPAVPIGRPIANMRATVRDAAGTPAPLGVAGELWLEGAGLARGYAGRDDLTAAAFGPVAAAHGTRHYRTGDRARLRPDGVMEYLGRTDDQVKVRGARIELGEVEAALASAPGVDRCVAAVHRPGPRRDDAERVFCRRCGLSSDYPGVSYDAEGVCGACRAFDGYRDRARVYFKSMPELEELFASVRADPPPEYDCLVLLSGGKDSTYMLCRLVEMDLRILAFTLDNGYISEQAKGNIRRVVDALGVDHLFGSTEAMNEIFVDSLLRHANVCHGCYKTIYTLSMQVARRRRIPFIVTGLSRGQFFETRLTPDLFTELTVSADRIEADVLAARKAYHRTDDAVRRTLDVSLFEDDRIFEEVQFVDFYRYCDVDLETLYATVDRRVPWVRPTDTGRSTNCRINDVGIFVHQHQRGFHNYALPYSWDVRVGHKTRDEALAELEDQIDPAGVQQILAEIGYPGDVETLSAPERLVAYVVCEQDVDPAALRVHAAARLPAAAVPSHYVRIADVPLTRNGKVDRTALPKPELGRAVAAAAFVAPSSEAERALAGIWAEVLGLDRVGRDDDFFELGGDSIMAIQIVARARRSGLTFTLAQLFDASTVARLCALGGEQVDTGQHVIGPVGLTTAQAWLLAEQPDVAQVNHVVTSSVPPHLDPDTLERALQALVVQHDALRQRFARGTDGWSSAIDAEPGVLTLTRFEDAAGDTEDRAVAALDGPFELDRPPLLRAGLLRCGAASRLVLVAHHLIVDAVSWLVLLDDLGHVYGQLAAGHPASLPAGSASPGAWAAAQRASLARTSEREGRFWREQVASPAGAAADDRWTPDRVADEQRVLWSLDPERTETVLRSAAQANLGVDELLVAALALTLVEARGHEWVQLMLEGHGRESDDVLLDATRSIGWFATLYPIRLQLPAAPSAEVALGQVSEQLRRVPRRGAGYGVLRYLDPDRAARASLALPAEDVVVFNYLGVVDPRGGGPEGFGLCGPIRLSRSERALRSAPLELNAVVSDRRLTVSWCYGTGHDRATIEAWAACFERQMQSLTAACEARRSGGPTAADFPLAGLDAAGLSKLAALLSQDR